MVSAALRTMHGSCDAHFPHIPLTDYYVVNQVMVTAPGMSPRCNIDLPQSELGVGNGESMGSAQAQ